MDAITLNGDEVNRRGGLHGGFLDPRRSRLEAFAALRSANARLDSVRAEQDKIKQFVAEIDQVRILCVNVPYFILLIFTAFGSV
jgi:structural maintenance of chromosome 3 (chondroitin sulfate proteoglycan 6)